MFWKKGKISRLSLLNCLMVLYLFISLGLFSLLWLLFQHTFMSAIQNGPYSALSIKCYIIISLILASWVASFASYWVAKKGLKKLDLLGDKIRRVRAHSLHERLNSYDYPHELRLLSESFNEMLEQVEFSFKRLSDFSSNIAHELRTPLHNLIQSTEVFLAQPKEKEAYESFIGEKLEDYQQLSKITNRLLFIAKSESKQMVIKKERVLIKPQIESLFQYYETLASEKRITLLTEGDVEVDIDLVLFRQMMSNLLSNAIRFTPPGGKISAMVSSTPENEVTIIVKDTGVGIEVECLERLFERFYRIDPCRNQETGGLGLGLSIVKAIVDLHGGEITVQSEVGIGTVVEVLLPKKYDS